VHGGGVVFVGDDRTDEEVFVALGDDGCSVRVGPGATAARFRLAGPPEVLRFLEGLIAALAEPEL
jgi:trehalose 6-phosphate phosphatase